MTKLKSSSIGDTLREVVWQAMEQDRLTSGVTECAQLLEIDPYNVMLCVLPTLGSEVSLDIHHMLIEAFCREYDIRLVKVDSLTKMETMVQCQPPANDNCVKTSRVTHTDISCLIIQYPEVGSSEEEENLNEFYKNAVFNDSSHTCEITLPD